MTRQTLDRLITVFLTAGFLGLASCSSEQKPPPPTANTTVKTQPGVAGSMVRNVVTMSVTINAIDAASRRLTLLDSDGNKFAYTVGPEVKNFDQMHPGDRVTATFDRTVSISVSSDANSAPGETYSAAAATARPGDKPGALVAEVYETRARVVAIDMVNRTATLKSVDGTTDIYPVRSDVDLSRYKVGDTVVERVSSTVMVLVAAP